MARNKIEKNIYFDDEKNLYYVNMDYGKNESGKRIKKTPTYKTLPEARKALKVFEADKTKGTLIPPQKTTLDEWLTYWMNTIVKPNRAVTTIYGYQQIIDNHISPALGKIPVQDLKPKQIQEYYGKMQNEKNLKASTVRKHHDLLNEVLKLAVKQDLIIKNPIDRVDAPKAKRSEAKYYTPEQLLKLFELVDGSRLEIVVKLGAYAGLRREEICGLKWTDIDFEKRVMNISRARTMAGSKIIIKETKSDASTRPLSIEDELFKALMREKLKQEENRNFFKTEYIESGFVAVWENGKPYRPNYLSEMFMKLVTRNNLPKIVLHGLRHTFASLANRSDATLYDISKALGHSSPSITAKIYTHTFQQANEETMKKVADSLK